ncbi:hypothetical protein L484_012343 [Morus notabilis]|uniref:Nuclear pore complex protein NUP1 n=1 Tax=Morus notabilis TaxID=981085 RepID=W9S1J8_9ROSA|nr:hypothetical protein L484_012343 [Morus notabilis]
MEKDVETTSSAARYGEERGAGGKLRKARKPPSTPYARPHAASEALTGQRRWLSKLVDPACRLISGGASLIFPSFFSKSPIAGSDTEDHDDSESETEAQQQDAGVDYQNCTINHEMSRTTGVVGTSKAVDVSESISDLVWQKQDQKGDLPNENGLSEIEHLLKGKKDEVNRLMEVINSRAVELPNVEKEKKYQSRTPGGETKAPVETKGPAASQEIVEMTSERSQRDLHGSLWKTSTPLPQSIMPEVAASPIEIAKAYMGSRTIDTDNSSRGMISRNERSLLFGAELPSKPFIPPPSPKPSAYWPGAMLTPSQVERDKWLRPPTSVQKLQTPVFGQAKPRSDVLEDEYGSVGPIRRPRHKISTQTPFRGSNFIGSSVGPSKVENSNISQGFLLPVNRNFEPGGSSSSSQFQSVDRKNRSFDVGVPTVHPQSSQIARTILEHIDRNPPTPKDKSEELKLAIAWKKPVSSSTLPTDPNGQNSVLNVKGYDSHKIVNIDGQEESAQENADEGNSLFMNPRQENTAKAVDSVSNPPRSDVFLGNGGRSSQIKSLHGDVTMITSSQVLNLQKKPATSGTKPVLSSISINKPDSKWTFSSDQGSGFTFPVSTSSEVLSEPPTPSIVPSFLVSGQHQPKDGVAVPSYTFGSSKSSSALVFSFPSTSSSAIQNDSSDIKFSFGSDKPRLSFSSITKDAICY